MKQYDSDWDFRPINLPADAVIEAELELVASSSQVKKTLVEYHKDKLGGQDFCTKGVTRQWVWDFPTFRIYVNNDTGVSLEVLEDLTDKEEAKAWYSYQEKMGLRDEEEEVLLEELDFE